MTREIIIFGRRFGYTPANTVTLNKHHPNTENSFKDIIKQHIKEEQLKNVTITYNEKIKDFLKKYDDLTKLYKVPSTGPPEIIDIDGDDENAKIQLDAKQSETFSTGDKLVLDVNKIMNAGGMLVNDICHDIQINLDKEEIVEGKFWIYLKKNSIRCLILHKFCSSQEFYVHRHNLCSGRHCEVFSKI